jgi:hypothetical protein
MDGKLNVLSAFEIRGVRQKLIRIRCRTPVRSCRSCFLVHKASVQCSRGALHKG